MDVLAALLDGPRARGAFVLRVTMSPPWSIRVEDRAPLAVISVVRGHAVIVPEGPDGGVCLGPGDVAVVRSPDPYLVADGSTTAPTWRCAPVDDPLAVILDDERCVSLDGSSLEQLVRGVRTWGNDPEGPDVMVVGTYPVAGAVSGRLLAALPPLLTVRAGEWDNPVPGLLGVELARDEPGQTAVLDRLLDLLLIGTLRTWFTRQEAAAPGWYRAQADPVVGHALRLLHHDPAAPWTVASLASAVGISRAALARRFTDLVGEPPMSYLAGWRISLAADRLLDPGVTVAAVAAEVGYATPFALSNAFKRRRGVSPREHQRRAAPAPVP